MRKLGACLSFQSSNLESTIHEALSINANTFMIYYGSPTTYKKPSLNFAKINTGLDFAKKNGINPEDIILHTNYLSNFASPEEEKRNMAMNILAQEINFAKSIGIKYLVCHPGSYTTGTQQGGLQNVANCLNTVIEECDDVVICLETMAGKGKEVGRDFEEIQCILENIDLSHKVGVCLDTAHTWDAGYDWNKPDEVLDEFDGIIGLDKLKVIHLNGSLNSKGSKKDRHANIYDTTFGINQIGSKNLYNIFHNPRLENIPFILETPEVPDEGFIFTDEIEYLLK